jgi:negative regulator of sigma E activity
VEEDVATPTNTVVTDDGSWIGRTIVTLVIVALVVVGAIWLVRALSDNNGTHVNTPDVNVTQNDQPSQNNQPSNVLPS